jgi:hypothetical protein
VKEKLNKLKNQSEKFEFDKNGVEQSFLMIGFLNSGDKEEVKNILSRYSIQEIRK